MQSMLEEGGLPCVVWDLTKPPWFALEKQPSFSTVCNLLSGVCAEGSLALPVHRAPRLPPPLPTGDGL